MDQPPALKLLKVPEVAARLRVSNTHAYRLIELGQLQAVRFGRNVRVRPADLDQFVLDHLTGAGGEVVGDG